MNYSPTRIRSVFNEFLGSIKPEDVARSPGDFTRNRLCPLPDTLGVLLSMSGHSLNTEISDFFFYKSKSTPTKSAFSQQRSKLTDDALPNLFRRSNELFPFRKTFKGLHLLAADGSDLNVPSLPGDTSTFMPYNSGKGGYHQMHLHAILDLLEGRYLDATSTTRRDLNENRELCIMVDRNPLKGSCLYIADRGYCSFNTFAHIIKAGQFFLIRANDPSGCNSMLKKVHFPDKDEFDIDHHFIVTRGPIRKSLGPAVYKHLRPNTRFDFIDADDRESLFRIDFRIIKVSIGENRYEYLLTNLPRMKFPRTVIKDLYAIRWGIETSFRKLKYNLALNYFHSKKRTFICQEMFARLTAFNLAVLIIGSIRVPTKNTKYEYVISFADSVTQIRRFLLNSISATKLKNLLLKYLIPIRPGRTSPRNVRSQRLKTLNNRY